MNNTPVTQPEFGVYKISKDYLRFIRKTNPAVTDPDITNVYCGPVRRSETNRGPVDYFVPVDIKEYKKNSFFLMDFSDGILAGIMDFKRTIPCLPDEYEFDTSNPKLSEFCRSCKTQILECAAILAEIQAKKKKHDRKEKCYEQHPCYTAPVRNLPDFARIYRTASQN